MVLFGWLSADRFGFHRGTVVRLRKRVFVAGVVASYGSCSMQGQRLEGLGG